MRARRIIAQPATASRPLSAGITFRRFGRPDSITPGLQRHATNNRVAFYNHTRSVHRINATSRPHAEYARRAHYTNVTREGTFWVRHRDRLSLIPTLQFVTLEFFVNATITFVLIIERINCTLSNENVKYQRRIDSCLSNEVSSQKKSVCKHRQESVRESDRRLGRRSAELSHAGTCRARRTRSLLFL